MNAQDVDLDDWIAHLRQQLDKPDQGTDVLQLLGALCEAYAERGRVRESLDDLDAALDYGTRLRHALPRGDADGDLVAIYLAELYWVRLNVGRLQGLEGRELRTELDATIGALGTLRPVGDDPELASAWRVFSALIRIDRYRQEPRPEELDDIIRLLDPAVWELPDGIVAVEIATVELANLYVDRAERQDDQAAMSNDVDRAVSTVDRAQTRVGDDPSDQSMLRIARARAYQVRWDRTEDVSDLELALLHWRAALAAADPADDQWEALETGILLTERADRTDNREDIAGAVALLERIDGSDPVVRFQLGRAHQVRFRLDGDRTALERADQCFADVADWGVDDDDDLLRTYDRWLDVRYSVLAADEALTQESTQAAARRLDEVLRRARDAFDRAIGADPDRRATFAGVLAMREMSVVAHLMGTGEPSGQPDLTRIRGLIALAGRRRDAPALWSPLLAAMAGTTEYAEDSAHSRPGADFGVEHLVQALKEIEREVGVNEGLRSVLGLASQARASRLGDVRGTRAAERILSRHRTVVGPSAGIGDQENVVAGHDVTEDDVIAAVMGAAGRGQVGDVDAMTRHLGSALDLIRLAPRTPYIVEFLEPLATSLYRASTGHSGANEGPSPPGRPLGPAPVGWAGDVAMFRDMMGVMPRYAAATRSADIAEVRACAREMDVLVERAGSMPLLRTMTVGMAGSMHLGAARLDPFDRRAARRAQSLLEEVLDRLGKQHLLWPPMAMSLAEAIRRAGDGDRARARALAIEALRGRAQLVLLQARPNEGLEVARLAASDVATLVTWCLADSAYEDLVATLDAGRGLVLHAAAASPSVAQLLEDKGHAELARQWRETAGHGRDSMTGASLADLAEETAMLVPDTLRARVLAALATSDEGLTTVAEARAALVAAGADALVYLVPATAEHGGVAVIVRGEDVIEVLSLPNLRADGVSVLDRYVAAIGMVADDGYLAARLNDVGRWAWNSAVGELLDHASRWGLARPAQLVLVPMGRLGLVPWHAAFTGYGSDRHYAVRDAAFTYAPSARMLRLASAHPAEPIRSSLVVGDPTANLAFAGIEARSIHEAFYRSGTYLGAAGRPGDGLASADAIRRWIANATGPSMLHFACHGHMDTQRPADAYLELADGPLRARDLLEDARLSALVVDQVFLAACTTSTSGDDYDEAFSLATAFLAAGARTVFGSLWSVPDAATSLMMFMVHQHLQRGHFGPAEALRAAQLWMLDPDRQVPEAMPPLLAVIARRVDATDPVTWAAFTHLGR